MDRADRFGLADLYQLRGRVGRGDRRAFAYFLVPHEDRVTDEARDRLDALTEHSCLGAGSTSWTCPWTWMKATGRPS